MLRSAVKAFRTWAGLNEGELRQAAYAELLTRGWIPWNDRTVHDPFQHASVQTMRVGYDRPAVIQTLAYNSSVEVMIDEDTDFLLWRPLPAS